MTFIGFDFGTTNSLISIIQGGRAIHFLDEEQRPTPSVICYEGAQKIIGRDAKERLSQAGLGVQGNIVRSPKMYLGRDSVFLEGTERSPVDIVADVVRYVLDEAQSSRRDLGEVTGAVVTIPVNMEGYQRRALREAFRLAGLRIVQFVHEPLAALYGFFRSRDLPAMLRRYDKKLVLVFDWGGGTLDLTLCRPMDDMVVQIMNDGTDEVGGDVFDESLMNRLVERVATKRGLDESFDTIPGAKARLIDRCERAKIDLSSRSNVAIYVGSFFRSGEEEFDYSLSQGELEKIVAPLLEKGFQRIERILDNAGYAPEQVALCVATGGMSNMPAVKRRLHEWFGPERVQIPDGTATLIAEGAAWIAGDEVGLQLAKNVELVLARNSFLPLIKSGTAMPKEGEVQCETFDLYCTDPRDGVAKFQICAPKRAGTAVLPSEPRTYLENVTVRVDAKARAFQERLVLNVQVNDDLVLEAHARSLNKKDDDRCEIHNLEFGLRFPADMQVASSNNEEEPGAALKEKGGAVGALSVRANVADRADTSLVPGEFLFEYAPAYFDCRNNPPKQQVNEKLYYQPCSLCGRVSNDLECQCSS
jgi:actin-like ATPase involved in cell morphogenesis